MIVPCEPLLVPPPRVEDLRKWAQLLEAEDRQPTPGELADVDQGRQAERDLTRIVAEGNANLTDVEVPAGLNATVARLAVGLTIQRRVNAHCRHVDWPLHPYSAGAPVVVVMSSRSATCRSAGCMQAALALIEDDGTCDCCDNQADGFHPLVMAVGRVVTNMDVCDDCATNIFGKWGPS